jgi:PLP dependent protein
VTTPLETRYRALLERIDAACGRAKRDPASVRLLAVSKTKPAGDIELAHRLGLVHFGENYVQELVGKRAELAHLPDLRWHLIGHLQSNKIAKAVSVAHAIHTIDSLKRLQEIDRRASAAGVIIDGSIEVNVGREPQKAGVLEPELAEVIAAAREAECVRLRGLMAIPPESEDPEQARPHFRRLRELGELHGVGGLSMGMSHDFEVAIEEGATDVRVGSALFGPRERA